MRRNPGSETPDAQPGGAAPAAPASLWPAQTRPAELDDSGVAPGRPDPTPGAQPAAGMRPRAALELCAPLLALRVVLLVQAALAIGVLATAGGAGDWPARLAAAMYAGIAGSIVWLVAACAARAPLARLGDGARAAWLMGLGAAVALLAFGALQWAGLGGAANGVRLAGVAAAGAALAGLVWAWLDQRARLWQPVDAGVRLAELQSRIRPHFLFNTLNTAAALVRVDPARAEGVLEDLAQLFRVALAEPGASVALDEEIELAQRYLAIEQLRCGARLQLHWDIDEHVGAARVPPLVLPTLVENAVKHGLSPLPAGGQVEIGAEREGDTLLLWVQDNGAGFSGSGGAGVGLANTRARLAALYGPRASLALRAATPRGVRAEVRLPWSEAA